MLVKEGAHMRRVDPEALHEAEEVDIDALFRKIESLEADLERRTVGKAPGDPSVPGDLTHRPRSESESQVRLGRLTEYKNKQGDVSSVLAWDDLTGMKLEAGKVVEA